MTLTRWTTIAAACAVLGAVGGGVRVAARQDGARAKPDAVSKPEETRDEAPKMVVQSSPALKTLEEMQSWIKQWDAQVVEWTNRIDGQRNKIDQQQLMIQRLEAEIAELKARDRAVAEHMASDVARPKAEPPAANPAKTEPAPANTAKAEPPGKPEDSDEAGTPVADHIRIGPTSIVSISGANDRAVIYSNISGQTRTYRPPQKVMSMDVTFHDENVTIVASTADRAHLVNYNVRTDRWDLQDIRGATGGIVYILQEDSGKYQPLVPCHFDGAEITQVAILDLGRGAWTIQNLDEPLKGRIAPRIKGKLAVYTAGKHVYAYSGEAGRWDTLTLEEPLFPTNNTGGMDWSPLSLQEQLVAVSQHGRLHVFTAKEGKWKAINPRD